MAIAQCFRQFWAEHAALDDAALLQSFPRVPSSSSGLHTSPPPPRDDNPLDRVGAISFRALYRWIQQLQVALKSPEGGEWLVVAINVAPFSIEETALLLLVAEQQHWVYVPVDIELPLSRQLAILRIARVDRLVTLPDSPLACFIASTVASVDHKDFQEATRVKTLRWETIMTSTSPFRPVKVFEIPLGHFHSTTKHKSLYDITHRRFQSESNGTETESPLYVLFTSGSTGDPRGVLGTRAGAWSRLEWMWTAYPFAKSRETAGGMTGERVLRATKLSFVDSIWEILGAFLQGAALVHLQSPRRFPPGDLNRGDGYSYLQSVILDESTRFLEMMRSQEVTRFTAVPSVLEMLLLQTRVSDRKAAFAGLRYVLSSGETLSLGVIQQFLAEFPAVTVLNLYGSTEVSGDVTCMELKAPQISTQTTLWEQHGIPIGSLRSRDVVGGDKTALMLLRVTDDPVESEYQDSAHPIWPKSALNASVTPAKTSGQSISGLLYVTGPLVALGYLSDDQGDAEIDAFVDGQPPWSEPKDGSRSLRRWVCTGDVCSVTGGSLYFVGRKDHMVKIRGQRVYLVAVERAVAAALAVEHDKQADERYSQVIALAVTLKAVKYALHQQQIVVFLVLDSTTSNEALMASYPQKRGLYAWIAEHYGTSHVPYDVILVGRDAVQRLTQGKLDRRGLESLYTRHLSRIKGNGQSLELVLNPENGSDSALLGLVVRLLSNILNVSSSAGLSDIRRCTFSELGGNSLLATLFVYELHTAGFDKSQLTTPALLGMTVGEMVLALKAKPVESLPLPVKPQSSSDSIKRRKTAHPTPSFPASDAVGSAPPGQLSFLSRYNQSSTEDSGPYLPLCHATASPSAGNPQWALRTAWQVDLGKCVDASPLLVQQHDAQGAVISTWAIIGSHSSVLVCVDVDAGGREIWRVQLDDRIEACAAISLKLETVYVGTYGGTLFALDLKTGTVRWRCYSKEAIKATALVLEAHNLVVCGTYDHHLYGLDAATGSICWMVDLQGSVFSTPFYSKESEQLFAASTSGFLVGLTVASSSADGVELHWSFQLPAPVFAGLNADLAAKVLVVGCADGQLYGVAMASGRIQWRVSTEKPIFSSPCVYRPGFAVFGCHDGFLRKVRCCDGALAWTTDLKSAIFASPTVVQLHTTPSGGGDAATQVACCVTTTAGHVYLCDEASGVVLHQSSATGSDALGPIFGSPVLVGKWCLLGTRTNFLYAFELLSCSKPTEG